MKNKRFISVAALSLLLIMVFATTVFAHPGHGKNQRGNRGGCHSGYALCSLDDCNLNYTHQHNGTSYSGHRLNDGHGHQRCNLEDCTLSYVHQHDGNSYFGCPRV